MGKLSRGLTAAGRGIGDLSRLLIFLQSEDRRQANLERQFANDERRAANEQRTFERQERQDTLKEEDRQQQRGFAGLPPPGGGSVLDFVPNLKTPAGVTTGGGGLSLDLTGGASSSFLRGRELRGKTAVSQIRAALGGATSPGRVPSDRGIAANLNAAGVPLLTAGTFRTGSLANERLSLSKEADAKRGRLIDEEERKRPLDLAAARERALMQAGIQIDTAGEQTRQRIGIENELGRGPTAPVTAEEAARRGGLLSEEQTAGTLRAQEAVSVGPFAPPAPTTTGRPTEKQITAGLVSASAVEPNAIAMSIENDFGDRFLGFIPLSENGQLYSQASNAYFDLLRTLSGAAIPDTEVVRMQDRFFAQRFDTAAVIAQKQRDRTQHLISQILISGSVAENLSVSVDDVILSVAESGSLDALTEDQVARLGELRGGGGDDAALFTEEELRFMEPLSAEEEAGLRPEERAILARIRGGGF